MSEAIPTPAGLLAANLSALNQSTRDLASAIAEEAAANRKYFQARAAREEAETANVSTVNQVLDEIHASAGPDTDPVEYIDTTDRLARGDLTTAAESIERLRRMHGLMLLGSIPVALLSSGDHTLAFGNTVGTFSVYPATEKQRRDTNYHVPVLGIPLADLHAIGFGQYRDHSIERRVIRPYRYLSGEDKGQQTVNVGHNIHGLRVLNGQELPRTPSKVVRTQGQIELIGEPRQDSLNLTKISADIVYGSEAVAAVLRNIALRSLYIKSNAVKPYEAVATAINLGIDPDNVVGRHSRARVGLPSAFTTGIGRLVSEVVYYETLDSHIVTRSSLKPDFWSVSATKEVMAYLGAEDRVTAALSSELLTIFGSVDSPSAHTINTVRERVASMFGNYFGIAIDPGALANRYRPKPKIKEVGPIQYL